MQRASYATSMSILGIHNTLYQRGILELGVSLRYNFYRVNDVVVMNIVSNFKQNT